MSRCRFTVVCLVALCSAGLAAPPAARAEAAFDQDWAFFAGNLQFTLLHELGHAFLAESQVPVLGDEESAADELATIVLLLAGEGDSGPLLAAADGWLLEWGFERQAGFETPFWDPRPLKIQRFYQIVCMVFGSDPDAHANWRLRLPYERSGSCLDEYHQARRTLRRLQAWIPAAGDTASGRLQVVFETPATRLRERIAGAVRDSNIIADTLRMFTALLPLRQQLKVVIANGCEATAYWREDLREVIICYALIEQFMYLARFRHCVNHDRKSAPRPRPPDAVSVDRCLVSESRQTWLPHWPVPGL